MSTNFFELKYLITDCFYNEIMKNNYSLEQSAGICYESFSEYINSDSIEMIISISEIICLKIRHNAELNENDKADMKKILDLYNILEIDKILNADECEYLDEKMQIVEYYYKQ